MDVFKRSVRTMSQHVGSWHYDISFISSDLHQKLTVMSSTKGDQRRRPYANRILLKFSFPGFL